MKILISGARGMLGTDICNLLGQKHDVTCVNSTILNITHFNEVIKFAKNLKPEIIINCTAMSNVDGCETEIDKAFLINAIGPKNLAIASNEVGAQLIHYSTDYVFDGAASVPYTEFDTENPQSIYGKSKLAGENYVKNLTSKYYIIRLQWLFGKNGPNFVKTILKHAAETGKLKVVNDQIGSPTYTKDLACATLNLLNTCDYGTYHITNSGIVSWYEFTVKILELMSKKESRFKDVELSPCTTEEFPRPAKRPKYSPLDNYCLKLNGYPLLRPYEDALTDYLNEM